MLSPYINGTIVNLANTAEKKQCNFVIPFLEKSIDIDFNCKQIFLRLRCNFVEVSYHKLDKVIVKFFGTNLRDNIVVKTNTSKTELNHASVNMLNSILPNDSYMQLHVLLPESYYDYILVYNDLGSIVVNHTVDCKSLSIDSASGNASAYSSSERLRIFSKSGKVLVSPKTKGYLELCIKTETGDVCAQLSNAYDYFFETHSDTGKITKNCNFSKPYPMYKKGKCMTTGYILSKSGNISINFFD